MGGRHRYSPGRRNGIADRPDSFFAAYRREPERTGAVGQAQWRPDRSGGHRDRDAYDGCGCVSCLAFTDDGRIGYID